MNRPDALRAAITPVAPIPQDDDGTVVFREPWEAQAFAMTLALHERGLFTWPEWAAALAEAIARAQAAGDPDDGSTYYRHWLAAIEHLVERKGVVEPTQLAARRDAWDRAAHATPLGAALIGLRVGQSISYRTRDGRPSVGATGSAVSVMRPPSGEYFTALSMSSSSDCSR